MVFRFIVLVLALFVFGVEVSFADQGEQRLVFSPDDISLRDSLAGSIIEMNKSVNHISQSLRIQSIKGLDPEKKKELLELTKRMHALSIEINTQADELNKVFKEEDPKIGYFKDILFILLFIVILLIFFLPKTKNEVKGAVTNPKMD